MAATLNPETLPGILIGTSVSSVADWLRSITVGISEANRGRGSGVIWRNDGLILTNAHVAKAKMQWVVLADGRHAESQTLARDSSVDLAALRVDLPRLPAASVRSARQLRTGEVVIAVGNPWDGDGAVSAGIVHRTVGTQPCVFADIRLAPGNSGGPLADAHGNVIGINSAIVGGLGCAVTSDAVEEFLRKAGLS
jgi:serine protease Do